MSSSPITAYHSVEPRPRHSLFAHLLRVFTFRSGDAIYRVGRHRPLGFDDLLPLTADNTTAICFDRFQAAYTCHGSLLLATFLVYGRTYALCGLGRLYVAASGVFAPIVVHHVVSAFGTDHLDYSSLSTWLIVFFTSRVVSAIVSTQVDFAMNHIALRVTGAMKSLLFRKALRRDVVRATQTNSSNTEISNLVSSDTNGMLYAVLAAHNAWILPLQVLVITYLLYRELDVAAFAGVGIVVGSLVLNYAIARIMGKAYGKLMAAKDARMKTVKEVFGAIQIVKFNAWEPRFHAKLTAQRGIEIDRLAVYSYASAASMFVLWSSPFFVSTVSFAVYALVLDKPLTAAKVFSSMALFNAMRDPLRDLPTTIQSLIQSRVSVQRLNSFLAAPDLDTSRVLRSNECTQVAVSVQGASFAWSDTIVLRDIDMQIERGDFVVVSGAVGSGKSSLLSGMLGEMSTLCGTVSINGRVGYYTQQPWIQNMSIRDNILFGSVFDADKYAAVLDACCLYEDLKLFEAGDATEIGEKGVNLSGGQKARVALARACYSDADIYLLDSPLAAVDTLVQKQIFDRCFCGLLRKKTIVLVTHNTDIISSPMVNCRVALDGGCITAIERNLTPQNRAQRAFFPSAHAKAIIMKKNCTPSGVLVQEEERQEGQISVSVWQQYLKAVGGYGLLVVLLVTQLGWQGFQIGSDFWLSHWTSQDTDTTSHVSYYTGMYAGLASSGAVMVLIRGIVVAAMGMRAARFLFSVMTEALLHTPIRFFDVNPIGRIINRYADDISAVDVLIPSTCSTLLSAFFSTAFALITAAVTIQYAGLSIVPIVYIYTRIAKNYVRMFCNLRRMLKVVNSPILSHISQSEAGASVLRAFGRDYIERAVLENHRRVDVNSALWGTDIVMIQWFSVRLQLLGCVFIAIVTGSFVLFADWFSPGTVGIAFTYALSIDGSLLTLIKSWAKAENALVGVERVLEYSDLPQESQSNSLLNVEPAETWPHNGAIDFHNVRFAYKPGDPDVLKNITFSIKPREKIGIVGRTGAGKSSLSMALLRMNELSGGAIRIDGIDIAGVPLSVLRSRIAIIPQSPVLLEGTLRHFLDPFDDFTDSEIVSMLAKVELLSTLQDTAVSSESPSSDVLQLPLHVNGENLSVGERQLLCVARALLRRCAIVVMDEATAAMDHETETKLSRMVARELRDVTQLTIAHRLATVTECDRILVMDQGRVVEFDTPASLMRKNDGAFSALVKASSARVERGGQVRSPQLD